MPLSRGGYRKRASGYADAGMRAWTEKIEQEKTRKASQNGTRTLTSGVKVLSKKELMLEAAEQRETLLADALLSSDATEPGLKPGE